MKEIKLLAKLGDAKYMEKFIYEGKVYLRSLQDFAEMEENNGIGDKLETAVNYTCPPDPEITMIFPDGREFKLSKGTKIEYCMHNSLKKGHIYCMSIVNFVIVNDNNLKIKEPQSL